MERIFWQLVHVLGVKGFSDSLNDILQDYSQGMMEEHILKPIQHVFIYPRRHE